MQPFHQWVGNAFCEAHYAGNPAATVILTQWLPDEVMQAIATQNNLPETTFLLPSDTSCAIRWFTPAQEVTMAGHATLAAADALIRHNPVRSGQPLQFNWRDGEFEVVCEEGGLFWMEFALDTVAAAPLQPDPALLQTFGNEWHDAFLCKDTVLVMSSAEAVRAFEPDAVKLVALPGRGLALTAAAPQEHGEGSKVDYVSRFFCPRYGVPEDPVTGSSHAILARYWAQQMGKQDLIADQLSQRGGRVHIRVEAERTLIGGRVRLFSSGTIFV